MKWKVLITGDGFDLNELAKSLTKAHPAIAKDEDGFVLIANIFSSLHDPGAVKQEAERILILINGAARMALGTRKPLSVGNIILTKDDGSRQHFVYVYDSIAFRDSVSAIIKHADGSEEYINQADPVAGWVNVGLRDANVAKVLRLLSVGQLSWVELYRIFEVVEQDTGGLDYIVQQGWATDTSLRRFKHTANSPAATGDDSRHGKESTQPPTNPMTLSEAKSLIETILHNWLCTK